MAENTAVAKAEEKTEVAHSNNKVTDYSLGIFGTSDNFIMAMQMAKALASSTIVPATFQKNDANCLIAIEQAHGYAEFVCNSGETVLELKVSDCGNQ